MIHAIRAPFFRTVDDSVSDFLPGDANTNVRARPFTKRARLAEDAQPHVTHCQAGGDVRLLHGLSPRALVYGRSGRLWWRPGLRLENIHRAVKPRRFARAALLPGRMLRHNSPPRGKRREGFAAVIVTPVLLTTGRGSVRR